MTLRTPAHLSAKALLASATRDPAAAPTLRDSPRSRAQSADSTLSGADFADTLRERAKPSSAHAEAEQTKDVCPSESDPQSAADASGDCDQSSDAAQTQDSAAAAADAESTSSASPDFAVTDQAAAVEVKSQPVTIHDLNVLLLQGQNTPKFALSGRPQTAFDPVSNRAASRRPSSLSDSTTPSGPDAASHVPTRDPIADLPRASGLDDSERSPTPRPTDPTSRTNTAPASASPGHVAPSSAASAPIPAPAAANLPAASASPAPSDLAANQSSTRSTSESNGIASVAGNGGVSTAGGGVGGGGGGGALLDRFGSSAPQSQTAGHDAKQPGQAFSAQLHRGLTAALNQKSGAVTVRLTPETLGQLKVQIRMTGKSASGGGDTKSGGADGGGVAATFEVSSPKVRDLLKSSIDSLRQALQDKGLELTDVKVHIAPQLPQRDLGLDPVIPQVSEQNADPSAFTAPDFGHSGNPGHSSHDGATSAGYAPETGAEIAVHLDASSPDQAADALGRSRYIALPDGRLGLVALA